MVYVCVCAAAADAVVGFPPVWIKTCTLEHMQA